MYRPVSAVYIKLPIMNRFNGWRRLAVALCALAVAITAAVAAVEWQANDSGMFVYRTLLPGSTIEVPTSQVVLPGGKVIQLKEPLNGREPWQIDWNTEREAAPVLVLNWKRALKLGLALPLATWLALEILALFARWISKGFRISEARGRAAR